MAKRDYAQMRRDVVLNYKANGGNMKQAMLDAGYSESYANDHSDYLSEIIGEEIREAQKEIDSPKIKSIQEIQEWWSEIMENTEEDMKDRIKCSELLARSSGAFVEKVQLSGEEGLKVVVDYGEDAGS